MGQSQKSFMWNMGTYPLYIPANFGEDTFKLKKVVHEKPDKKLTSRIRIRIIRIRTRNQIPGYLIRTSNITEPSYLVMKNH